MALTKLAALKHAGRAGLRGFHSLKILLVDLINLHPSISPINIQDSSYTYVLADRGVTVRKTSVTASQVYTIPSNDDVEYELGTMLGFDNDGTVSADFAIDTDTLTSRDDGTTGTRTIGPGGGCVALKVAATNWKVSGDQMT